jgi:hypothetical protein
MRRLAASLLLLLLCAGLALSVLVARESSVPACCRRSGKHHCAMLPQGDGFRAVTANCPYRRFSALTSHSTPCSTAASVLSLNLGGENSIALASPDLPLHVAGNAQKRGPPLS